MKKSELKKGQRLTDRIVANLEPNDGGKGYRIRDEGGLHLHVRGNGAKTWEVKYKKADGKSSTSGLGSYDKGVSLKKARELAIEKRFLLEQGITPTQSKKAEEEAVRREQRNTVAALLDEWHEIKKKDPSRNQRHLEASWRAVQRHVLPVIGHKPIKDIRPAQAREFAMSFLDQRGVLGKVLVVLRQGFDIAVYDERIDSNPWIGVSSQLPPRKTERYPHVPQEELPELITAILGWDRSNAVRNALLFLAINGWRPAMLLNLSWDEIDMDSGLVVIPAERMKVKVNGDFRSLLAPRSLAIFKEQQRVNGRIGMAFPSRNNIHQGLAQPTLSKALHRLGYGGRQCAHGFRHVMSTGLHERGWNHDWIEAQLAHKQGGVAGIYNRAEYLEQRREMLTAWENELLAE